MKKQTNIALGKLKEVLHMRLLSPRTKAEGVNFMLFLFVLALFSIASAHRADEKVYCISTITKEIRDLQSRYISSRTHMMKNTKKSTIISRAKNIGLVVASEPPIVVAND